MQDKAIETPMPLPNFVFLGPDKSGSSWLFQRFHEHPEIFTPKAKELFFFDQFFDRGLEWYSDFFRDSSPDCRVLADFSHDYMFSDQAIERIAQHLPTAKMMVSLRNPIDRAVSAYLYMRKQGRVSAPFQAAIGSVEELIEHGKYGVHIGRILSAVDRSRLYVADFDELARDPQRYLDGVLRFVGVRPQSLSHDQLLPTNAAAEPRSRAIASVGYRSGLLVRRLGFPGAVNRVKNSPVVQRGLYRSAKNPVVVDSATREILKELFETDVRRLDHLLDTQFADLWGFS